MNLKAIAWRIINHSSRFKDSIVGYHCPTCSEFYTFAKFTIEGSEVGSGENYTLCNEENTPCCEHDLPTPLSFFDIGAAKSFLSNGKNLVNTKVHRTKELILAHSKDVRVLN